MTVTKPPTTITAPHTPKAPDADWSTILTRLMGNLTESAPTTWSDHNLTDPGVTLAEAAAFGLADMHYRTAERGFDAWPLEVSTFRPDGSRHWHASLPVGQVGGIAGPLRAGLPTSAAFLEPLIRACREPSDAIALLAEAPWVTAWTSAQRPAVIALMRGRLVRAIAQEFADLVASAVDAEIAASGSLAERDARAVQSLSVMLPLWQPELMALVQRERRRRAQETLVGRLEEVSGAASAAEVAACRGKLVLDGLDPTGTPSEVDVAMAAARIPFALVPEQLESEDGRTQVWPPHPIQALTCEPVTSADYARRAREHPEVGRAWAVAGRLEGVAWNGLATGTLPSITVDKGAPALTLVVERSAGAPPARDAFLRAVLKTAIGTECEFPFPPWQDTFDPNDPRRVICDEVGASLLQVASIVVDAVVITGVGVEAAVTVQGVRDRIAAFFARGRGPHEPARAAEVSGPWPLHEQPPGGWLPGDPIRFTEVIEVMMADPTVLGVEQLRMQVENTPPICTFADGELAIPGNAVPQLAAFDCLSVRFAFAGGCSDA